MESPNVWSETQIDPLTRYTEVPFPLARGDHEHRLSSQD
jgi:hypothetical protein